MIILDVEQGTQEWKDARLSLPTASRFSEVITSKGEISKSRESLMWELIEERISGVSKKTFVSEDMKRGTALEPEAGIFFEMTTGIKMDKVGLCYFDENKRFGSSPDGLNQKIKSGLEIKCPSLKVHWQDLEKGVLPTKHFHQVQGNLYVTGMDCWHYFSYYPGIKPLHVVVERDEIWIAKLSKILDDFVAELDETYKLIVKA
jgi:putative phage-type endonuclease